MSSGCNRHVDARQMGGKRAAIGAALLGALAAPAGSFLSSLGLVAGNGLLDILDRQKQLLGIELLRTAAELRALQLAQKMPQPIHLRQRLVALGDRRVALRARRRKQRLQRVDIRWKLSCDVAHARHYNLIRGTL